MDTPRTDAHLEHLNLPDGRKIGIPQETIELCCQLERELAEARKESAINMENFKVTNRAYVAMDERRLKAEAELANALLEIKRLKGGQ